MAIETDGQRRRRRGQRMPFPEPEGGGRQRRRPRLEREEPRPLRPEPLSGVTPARVPAEEIRAERVGRPRPGGRPPGLAMMARPTMVLPRLPERARPRYTMPYGFRPRPPRAEEVGEGGGAYIPPVEPPAPAVLLGAVPAPAAAPAAEEPRPLYPLTPGDWEQLEGMPFWRREWEIASRTQRGIPLQGYEIHSISREGYPGSFWSGEWGPESESAWLTQAERGGGGGGGYVAPPAPAPYPAVVLPSFPETPTATAATKVTAAPAERGLMATAGRLGAPLALATPTLPSWYVQEPTFAGDIGARQQDILWATNSLLPFMNPQDQAEIARYLYVAVGGSAGPFASYLGANESPFGGPSALNTREGYEVLRTNLSNIKDNNLRAAALQMLDLAQGTIYGAGQPRTRAQEIALQDGLRRMVQEGPEGWDILGTILSKVFKPTELRPGAGEMVWSEEQSRYVPFYNVQWL